MPRSFNTADEYDVVEHSDAALSPQIVAEIRKWLEPTDYLAESGEFRRHLLSQAPGTGLWLCETDEYRQWHDSSSHGSLWIKGVPGAGKSVMAASIIQHLRATEDCPVLFFFFRNIIAANFSPRALIQDWLAQLLPHSSRLQLALQARLETKLSETLDSELIDLFLEGASSLPKLYCVADALDEMTLENRSFLDKLNSLATFRPRTLKLLMTSRPAQYLQSALRDSSIVHISLQQRLVDSDITSYIGHRFDQTPKSGTNEGQIARQEVVDMVARQSEGLFLYAKLTMDQVDAALQSDTPVDIHALEASLPVGLEQTYNSMLVRQREKSGVSVDFQVAVLEAVTHGSRPLRLNELASLMRCVYPELNPAQGFKSLIAASCGALIEILEDETLQICHHSFTEFLRGDTRTGSSSGFPIINSATAHKRLAIRCLRYLQAGSLLLEGERPAAGVDTTFATPQHQRDFDLEHYEREHLGIKQEKDRFDIRQARLIHPFLSYAVDNWSHHAGMYDQQDEELFGAVKEFLDAEDLSYRRWLVLKWGSTTRNKGTTEGLPTVLHIAAFAGLSEMIEVLLQDGASVSATDAGDRIPLHWAAVKGHSKVVASLLKHGSEPNAEDGSGLKPIHLAAMKNHVGVVVKLLEAGVEPNTIKTKENNGGRLLGGSRITRGECPILYATEAGHIETIEAMIPYCKGPILEQLLCESLRYGRSAAALAILNQSNVSPDATYRGATALYHACSGAHADVVEALIRLGADVRRTSEYKPRRRINGGGWPDEATTTLVHCLVKAWRQQKPDTACQAILSLLVGAGCDLEQLDGRGNTPLLLAVSGNNNHMGAISIGAIRALLQSGADPMKRASGDDALHAFLRTNHSLAGVQLLVDHGADVNSKNGEGSPVLHVAASDGYHTGGKEDTEATINYLLEKGADPNARDKYSHTVLRKSMSSAPNAFENLLSKTNDKREISRAWFGVAQMNIERFKKLLEILLAKGMDIDAKNPDWCDRTLYLHCLDNEEKRKILLKHGAKKNAVDHHGNDALHQLVSNNSTTIRERMTKLIEEGLDPKSVNDNGSTLLHQYAYWYNWEQTHASHVSWIISLGIDVNAVDKQGRTVAHLLQTRSTPGSTVHGMDRRHMLDVMTSNQKVNLEIRDKDGHTPLHLAVIRGLESEVLKLVELGADVGSLTTTSENSLHLACRARYPSLVAQLLGQTQGMDIDQKDKFGRTPLHVACASGEPDSVAFLIKYGARVDIGDSKYQTPLHACAEAGLERDLRAAESHRKSLPWLRGGTEDPLRPTEPRKTHTWNAWYQYKTTSWEPKTDPKSLAGISTIIRLLVDTGVNVTAIKNANHHGGPVHTALDDAIETGFGEFVAAFLENEELFQKATAHLEPDKEVTAPADHIREIMKAQMIMLLPPSRLDMLRAQPSHFDAFVSSPLRGLGILIPDDVAFLLNSCFDKDPQSTAHFKTVEKLMISGHLQVIERAKAARHYSTFAAVRDHLDRQRKGGDRYPDVPSLTALQMACRPDKSNMAALRLLVEDLHVDVNARCATLPGHEYSRKPTDEIKEGAAALHFLASAGSYWQVEALRYLIQHGADVNALDEQGQSPLHIAAAGHSYDNHNKSKNLWGLAAVQVLLSHGADPNILDRSQESPLHKASKSPNIVRELLKRGADASLGGRNPLFTAIYNQNLATMEVLLDHGVSVDSINEKSHSRNVNYSLKESRKVYALLCTAYAEQINTGVSNSVPLLRCLIKRGADLYAPLNDDETMIHFLFERPEHHVPDALLQEPCVSRIDFNRRDQHGRTVLMGACRFRQVLPGYSHLHWNSKVPGHALRILNLAPNASAGAADATLTDVEGKTALHHILDNPGLPDDVLLQFIDHPAVRPTLLTKDNEGYAPLHYALRLLRPAVCERLMAVAGPGADLAEPDPLGRTALHHIAAGCMATHRSSREGGRLSTELAADNFDACVALWRRAIDEFGADINGKDKVGNSPLHLFLLSPCPEPRSEARRAASQRGGQAEEEDEEAMCCHLRHYPKLFASEGSGAVDVFAVNAAGESMLHVVSRREVTYYCKKGHDKVLFEAFMKMGLDPLKEDAKGRSALDVASACEKDEIVAVLGRK